MDLEIWLEMKKLGKEKVSLLTDLMECGQLICDDLENECFYWMRDDDDEACVSAHEDWTDAESVDQASRKVQA